MEDKIQICEATFCAIKGNSAECAIEENLAALLYMRDIKTPAEIYRFLYPSMSDLHSPFLMSGVREAVLRIKQAISKKEKIAIFADSDLDGITSLAIVFDVLSKCYQEPFIRYLKDDEGYGLTCDIIDEFIANDISLLITVDSGIRDIEEISYARQKGIDTIVTDHHEPDLILPDAIIINPKCSSCSYPFDSLAGVGVAFKLAHAFLLSFTGTFDKSFVLIHGDGDRLLIRRVCNGVYSDIIEVGLSEFINFRAREIIGNDNIVLGCNIQEEIDVFIRLEFSKNDINTLRGLAKFFTGTDFDDNNLLERLAHIFFIKGRFRDEDLFLKIFLEIEMRSYPKVMERIEYYLSLVAIGNYCGVMPLVGENRILTKLGLRCYREGKGHIGISTLLNNSDPSSKKISWSVAPLLNAPGRLGETSLTVKFFLTQNYEDLFDLIKSIERINNERKKIVASITDKLKDKIKSEENSDFNNIFFYIDEDVKSGIAGLIANRVADLIKKPVIIAARDNLPGYIKGSGRSYDDFDFFKFVEPFSSMFERIGGHAQAFGFTVKEENLYEVISKIDRAVVLESSCKRLKADLIIDIEDISADFIDSLYLLEPFGKSNEEPVFMSKGVRITSFFAFGNGEKHGRFVLKNGLHVIGWNLFEKMQEYYSMNEALDLIFTLENNIYLNKKYPRLILLDLDVSKG